MGNVNIMSDSRSALDIIKNCNDFHLVAFAIRRDIADCVEIGTNIHFFWITAHAGYIGNERADLLAKEAAQKIKTKARYDRCPISYIKKESRLRTLGKWNERYVKGETAKTTKLFWPDAFVAYKSITKLTLKPEAVKLLTGHGALAAYLWRFKIKDNPACTCDNETEQTSIHVLVECLIFYRNR